MAGGVVVRDLDVGVAWYLVCVIAVCRRRGRMRRHGVTADDDHRRFRLAGQLDGRRARRNDCFGQSQPLISQLALVAGDDDKSRLVQQLRQRVGKTLADPVVLSAIRGVG